MRERIQILLTVPGRGRALVWLVAPLLCLLLPGIGAIMAFVWIAALLWLGRQPLNVLGLSRQSGWTRTIVGAIVLAIVVSALSSLVLEPLVQHVVGHGADLSQMNSLKGNWSRLILMLLLSWLIGALVEETVFRGFLIGYGTRVLGERFVWPLVVLSSLIFGFSHLYQGIAGMLLTGTVGLVLSAAYALSRRNLALTMLAHGLIDTIGVVGIFLSVE